MQKRKSLLLFPIILMVFSTCIRPELEPRIDVSLENLQFTDIDTVVFRAIALTTSICNFEVEYAPEWIRLLSIEPTNVQNEVEITLVSDIDHSHFGTLSDELWLWSCLGRRTIPVECTVNSEIAYEFTDSLLFRTCEDTETFTLSNLGIVALEYDLILAEDLYGTELLSGTLQAGDSLIFHIGVNRSNIKNALISTTLDIVINEELYSIPVDIESFPDPRLMLNNNIIDAEYNRERDILVMAGSSSPGILIYDVKEDSLVILEMELTPTCLSIAPDGRTAAVGHEYHLTYIDLVNPGILKDFPISDIAYDIILSEAKWVYVTPKTGQWTMLKCFNLNEPEPLEQEHTNYNPIYNYSHACLHPSGKYIYTYYGGFLDKFDISNGVAAHIKNSNALTKTCGSNAWISRDGTLMYGQNTNVLISSQDLRIDLTYRGTIPVEEDNVVNSPSIRWLEEASSREEIYLIAWTHSEDWYRPFIYVHDYETLSYLRSYIPHSYIDCREGGSGIIMEADPKFIFCNSEESKLILLSHSRQSGTFSPWSVEMIDLE